MFVVIRCAAAGIVYRPYPALSEDRWYAGEVDAKRLRGILASEPGPVCFLGHMHEPWKCHRLALLELLDLDVVHLVWKSPQLVLEPISHAEALVRRDAPHAFHAAIEEALQFPPRQTRLREVDWNDFDPDLFHDGESTCFHLPFGVDLLWFPHFLPKVEADELKQQIETGVVFHLPTLFFNNKQGQVEQKLIRRAQRWISDDFDTFSQYGDWQTEAGAQRQYSLAFEEWSSALRDQVAGAAQAKKLRLNSHLQSTRESHMLNMFGF